MSLDSKLKIVKNIEDKCVVYNILCVKSCNYYNNLASLINFPLVFFSTLMIIGNTNIKNESILNIFNIIFNIFTTFTVLINTTYKFDSKMETFKSDNIRFIKLQYDCNKLINKIKDKTECDINNINELDELYELNEKIYNLKSSYDNIILNMVDIPSRICKKVYKNYKNKIDADKIPTILLAYKNNDKDKYIIPCCI